MSDLLRGLPGISSRAMFGGWAVYKDGVIFAIIGYDQLYFKADDQIRPEFERLGSAPFVYSRDDPSQVSLSYWLLPAEVMEDDARLKEWVERSVEASRRSKKPKKKSR